MNEAMIHLYTYTFMAIVWSHYSQISESLLRCNVAMVWVCKDHKHDILHIPVGYTAHPTLSTVMNADV